MFFFWAFWAVLYLKPKCIRWANSLKVLKGCLLQTQLLIYLPSSLALFASIWGTCVEEISQDLSDVCLHCTGCSSCMTEANQGCQTSLKRNDTYWYSHYLHLLHCSTQPTQMAHIYFSCWESFRLFGLCAKSICITQVSNLKTAMIYCWDCRVKVLIFLLFFIFCGASYLVLYDRWISRKLSNAYQGVITKS